MPKRNEDIGSDDKLQEELSEKEESNIIDSLFPNFSRDEIDDFIESMIA